ncbi:hypothetical protein [Streptomyces vilmorinianum]|uniref:hypothetical protein n=1 Tax=Streptomyces vilmorinianum TaxID=3051092 RepID=UPI0010FB91BC|nr:hypothetical protein [Streptomyces vilmorinianum]
MGRMRDVVDFGPGPAQDVVPAAVGMAAATGLLYLGLWWDGDPMSAETLRWCVRSGVVGLAGLLFLPRTRGARLTADCLLVFPAFGRGRRIPWPDVSDVAVRRVAGVRHVTVGLVTGERLTLRAPLSFLDRRFDARVRELTEWWRAQR